MRCAACRSRPRPSGGCARPPTSSATRPIRSRAPWPGARPASSGCSSGAWPTSGTRSSCAPSSASSTGPTLSTLVADADGEPGRELELAQRLVDHRVDGLVVVPIGPASGGWESIARQVATVTIGDALPGVAPAGEVVFDNERGVQQSLQHLERARPPPRHRALVGGRDVARPRGRARGRRLGGLARDRLPRGRLRVLAERLAPAGARAARRRRPPDRRPVPVGLDRLRRLRRVRRARAVDPRRRRGGRLRRPSDLAAARAAADLDGVGHRARGRAGHRLPAEGDRRRRPAGDAARGDRAGARGAGRCDGPDISGR